MSLHYRTKVLLLSASWHENCANFVFFSPVRFRRHFEEIGIALFWIFLLVNKCNFDWCSDLPFLMHAELIKWLVLAGKCAYWPAGLSWFSAPNFFLLGVCIQMSGSNVCLLLHWWRYHRTIIVYIKRNNIFRHTAKFVTLTDYVQIILCLYAYTKWY